MDRSTFQKLSDACIERVTAWLEDFDPDELDFTSTDGLLSFEFADGSKFILNRQSGNHQIWFAAGVRANHYDWDPETERWQDDRDGHQLFDRLVEAVAEKLGRELRF